MAESVDASDLKSDWAHPQCQFKSGSGHHLKRLARVSFFLCYCALLLFHYAFLRLRLELRFTVRFYSKIYGIHGCITRLRLANIHRQVWLRAPLKETRKGLFFSCLYRILQISQKNIKIILWIVRKK